MNQQGLTMEERIQDTRIRTLYHNAAVPLVNVVLIGSIMVAMLWDTVAHHVLFIWYVLLVLSSVIRGYVVHQFTKQADIQPKQLAKWARWFVYGVFVSGLLWASLVWVAVDFKDVFNSMALILTLIAMTAGALGGHAVYPPAYYAYMLPVMAALMIALFVAGGKYTYVAFMLIIFMITFIGYARIHYRLFTESLRQRFENDVLLGDLRFQKEGADKANADKTKFLASASHDLRQPIHAMNLFAEGLKHELTTHKQHKLLNKLKHAISAMGGLLDALLDMSKLDAGLVQVEIKAVSISALFDVVKESFAEQAAEKGLTLSVGEGKKDAYVRSDEVLLRNILHNLVSNAIKYTNEGEVKVRCELSGEHCLLMVEDSGLGIAEEKLDKVFQAFYQVGNPERDRTQGLGLGLSIVSRLCALLQHECTLTSKLGEGSQFTLVLPRAEIKAHQDIKPRQHKGLNQLNLAVLVIDDEFDILEGMRVMLESWGCSVIEAASMTQIEDVLQQKPNIDFIIADYRLSNHTVGTDAVIKAREILKNEALPAVIISGDTEPARMLEVKQAGFVMLHKPVRPAQIRSVMQRLTAKS